MIDQMNDSAGRIFEAARVADLGEGSVMAGFAYSVRILVKDADRRCAPRRRTRLRSGKLLNFNNGFLIECQVYDRSDQGARVRLPADLAPQSLIRLYEDDPERLLDARVVWGNESELGLCFVRRRGANRISRTALTCLRGRYYAIED